MKSRRYLFWFVFFGIMTNLYGQTLVPPSENRVIQQYLWESARGQSKTLQTTLEKSACPVLNVNEQYVIAGNTIAIKIVIDTSGLGSGDGAYGCQNCPILQFGTARLSNDTLFYTAAATVEGGKENVTVEFCRNGNCRTRTYRFAVRRKNRKHFQRTVPIGPDSSLLVLANESLLPGRRAICGALADCPDRYEGQRQQITLFSGFPNRLLYSSDTYAGVDSVCLVMCDTFAVCDTFSFAFFIRRDTLPIPFMDDFSYTGPFPDRNKWLDRFVFVNNDMADTPPSIGAATFDGLDDTGTAYRGGYGVSDFLTSTYLDLSTTSGEPYLTYWLQRRGFGDRPEVQDSVVLEFKDRTGRWNFIRSFPGIPGSQSDTVAEPFRFYRNLIPSQYRYKGFQFRFKNFSERTGILDVWHLDYVRLDGGSFTDSIFTDIAFIRPADFILKKYTSMPWRHFRANPLNELRDSVITRLWNHSDVERSLSSSHTQLFETVSNTRVFFVPLFNGLQSNIPNGRPLRRAYPYRYGPNDPTAPSDRFPATAWDSLSRIMSGPAFDNFDSLTFRLEYVMDNSAEQTTGGYAIPVKANNSSRRLTTFYNYFAYDDGTAEAGLIAQTGVQVAVEFTANVPDSLRAVQLHFPRTTIDVSSQEFNLRVWVGALDNTPDYEMRLRPVYTDIVFDTLQGFTTYVLTDKDNRPRPLYLPAGKFYVGWQQVSPCTGTQCVPIGYDRNTPGGKDFLARNLNGQWTPFPVLFPAGALMIRPVVGDRTPPPTTATDDIPQPLSPFRIFPNPVQSVLNISLAEGFHADFTFAVFSAAGQLLEQGRLAPQLDVSRLPAGMYFLKIADARTQQIWNERFIIAK